MTPEECHKAAADLAAKLSALWVEEHKGEKDHHMEILDCQLAYTAAFKVAMRAKFDDQVVDYFAAALMEEDHTVEVWEFLGYAHEVAAGLLDNLPGHELED